MSSILVPALRLASLVFILRALASWIPASTNSALDSARSFIYGITEPVLGPIRRALPQTGGLDLSVIIVILAINFFLIPIARQL